MSSMSALVLESLLEGWRYLGDSGLVVRIGMRGPQFGDATVGTVVSADGVDVCVVVRSGFEYQRHLVTLRLYPKCR